MIDETRVFEHEAEATRERIAATIDELQNRLSPRTIVHNAVDSISASGAEAVASVRGTLAGHPVALAAAGLAVGVTLLARSRIRGAEIEYGDSYAAYADYDDGYAANLADDDRDRGPARAGIEAIQHRAHVTVDDRPLAVIAVGLATGALLGTVVPLTATETSLFGEARGRLAAAGHAAVDAAIAELDVSKLSLADGVGGITERLSLAVGNVVAAAFAALARRPA